MIRHRILKAEAAEPAIGQVQMHLLAQPTLGADAEAVADQQHAHHQLRIDRRPAGVAVERGEMLTEIAEIEEAINAAEQVIRGNVCVEVEGIEQSVLCAALLSHHVAAISLQASS